MELITTIASALNIIAQTTKDSGVLNWLTEKYVAGGIFMHPILASLIIGLGFCFERLWTLTRARTNTKKFIVDVKRALTSGGVEAAKKVCENTRGPVASVFYAGLLRYDEGLDAAEKAISAYGGIGMIAAFDAIKEAAQISPAIVADGIAIALLTTLFGLVVAMILQVFYNYFVSRIDRLVGDMEQSSIELIDALYEIKTVKK
jgi:biopolymer transport protein ExbB